MNFDRFNPLSNYFSNNGIEVSDWGIEETTSSPSLSNHNFSQPYQHGRNIHELTSPTLFNENLDYLKEKPADADFMYYYLTNNMHRVSPSTENFQKFIKKYLSLNNIQNEFWEKFKYNLIISNLLDDSMILSKNEQSLNNLQFSINNPNDTRKKFVKTLNFDGTELYILNKQYQLKFSDKLYNSEMLIQTIYMIIFLLKQSLKGVKSKMSTQNKFKMFKILLIISVKLIQFKRINLKIQSTKVLNMLNDFLVNNYKVNKKLIMNLINLKEMEIFGFMKNSAISKNKVHDLKENLDNTLNFLNFNLKSSIIKLLPFLNGPMFEKYCNINNINVCTLNSKYDADGTIEINRSSEKITIDELTFKLNKFNQLRKFLVCQLLTVNESPIRSFFLFQVWDQFNITEYEVDEVLQNDFLFFEKLLVVEELFEEHTNIVKNFNSIFERFEKINKVESRQEDINNKDVLEISNQPLHSAFESITDTNMNNLINKLTNITTNLTYFKKYNQSISSITNIDEMNEKLMIFKQFGDELNFIKELYQVNLGELNNELYNKTNDLSSIKSSPRSSVSSSKRNSNSNGEFNLKSFHTVNSNSSKKRYSLPFHHSSSSIPSPTIQQSPYSDSNLPSKISNSKANGSDAQYKRLSTGLQLGLLTVFEEPNHKTKVTNNRFSTDSNPSSIHGNANVNDKIPGPVSYDDNYLNMLSSNNYNESYNQAALDSLSNNLSHKRLRNTLKHSSNNRYSLNSMNSNISGFSELLASTQITNYDDDHDGSIDDGVGTEKQSLSKEDLKLKLEESFNRIYNLENENENLKLKSLVDNTLNDNTNILNSNTNVNTNTITNTDTTEAFGNENQNNKAFLSELEKTLSTKVHT